VPETGKRYSSFIVSSAAKTSVCGLVTDVPDSGLITRCPPEVVILTSLLSDKVVVLFVMLFLCIPVAGMGT